MRQQMKLLRQTLGQNGLSAITYPYGYFSTGYCHVGNYGASTSYGIYHCRERDANLAARLQSAAEVDEILTFG